MRVVYWGTYDKGKPRNRIMIQGLRNNGVEVVECHYDIWAGIEDKSQIKGWRNKLRIVWRWLLSYPLLLVRYLALPPHDCVIIGYLGHLDVLVLWPFAKMKGIPIVWDAFLSLYNTVVEDRKILGRCNLFAVLLFWWELAACSLAYLVILDTKAHGNYFKSTFRLSSAKVKEVLVGAETEIFTVKDCSVSGKAAEICEPPFTVLFYGQYIPLHGIQYIVEAAKLTEHSNIQWVLIGTGQEEVNVREQIERLQSTNIRRIEWVPYAELVAWIHQAHVCLGIFGETDKAKRVIPNKIFQILASGRPLITGDTPAVRELLHENEGVVFVSLASPHSIASAVMDFYKKRHVCSAKIYHTSLRETISPASIGRTFMTILEQLKIVR